MSRMSAPGRWYKPWEGGCWSAAGERDTLSGEGHEESIHRETFVSL